MRFLLNDYVKTVKGSAVVGQGKIISVSEGGDVIGFPWKDSTSHYEFIDERTGVTIVAHERNLEKV